MKSPCKKTAGTGPPWEEDHLPELSGHGTTMSLFLIPPLRKCHFSCALQFGHLTDALLAMSGRVWAEGGSGGHELPCASHRWFWDLQEHPSVCQNFEQLEEDMGPSEGEFRNQNGVLLWECVRTLLSDCHQHNRALQEKATDVFLARAYSFHSLATLCLVVCVLSPCSQRHSSCSGTPAEDHLVPVSTALVSHVLTGNWPECTRLSFSLR